MPRPLNLFKRFDPRLAAELKTQQVTIIKGLVCAAVTSLLTAAGVLVLRAVGSALRRAGEGHVDMTPVTLAALATIALYAVKYVFTRGQTYYLSRAAARLAANMRVRLFSKLQRLPVAYFSRRRAGAIQSILTSDVGVYQTAVTIIRDSIDGPLKVVSGLITVMAISWQLGVLAILFMPPMVILIQRNSKKMRKAQKKVQEDLAALNATTQEALMGVRLVKAFSAEDRMEEIYRREVEATFRSQMGATRILAALKPLVELIGAFAIALMLYASGWLAMWGQLRVEDILAIALALDIVNQGFKNLASVNNTYAQVQAASERIYGEVLDIPEEQEDEGDAGTLPDPQGRIEFRNVSFAYPDGTLALRNVSFVLEPGTSLALVGPSGAGKSTIADLVLRFYDPSEGQVLFDGVDIRELKVSWLRSQMGVVPQHTFLFAGSITENIRLGAPEAKDEDVWIAARLAHADVFIDPTPNRYETEIGEGGVRLSGGERQRVAIARALVRKPKVLLLDEATSALDATSERAVQEALDEVMQSRTTLFIAHRLTTAARASRILVLKHGEVLEEGTHRELLEKGGEYAALFRVFSGGVLDEKVA